MSSRDQIGFTINYHFNGFFMKIEGLSAVLIFELLQRPNLLHTLI